MKICFLLLILSMYFFQINQGKYQDLLNSWPDLSTLAQRTGDKWVLGLRSNQQERIPRVNTLQPTAIRDFILWPRYQGNELVQNEELEIEISQNLQPPSCHCHLGNILCRNLSFLSPGRQISPRSQISIKSQAPAPLVPFTGPFNTRLQYTWLMGNMNLMF